MFTLAPLLCIQANRTPKNNTIRAALLQAVSVAFQHEGLSMRNVGKYTKVDNWRRQCPPTNAMNKWQHDGLHGLLQQLDRGTQPGNKAKEVLVTRLLCRCAVPTQQSNCTNRIIFGY